MRWLAASGVGVALVLSGVGVAVLSADTEPTVETATFTNVVTFTIPTVTETVVLTAPPATTVPPATDCTDELEAGGDLSTFLASLSAGDVGCLGAGSFTDGEFVSWNVDGATLTTYQGAEIVGTQIQLVGDDLTVRDVTIRETPFDRSCIGVNGARARIEHNTLTRCSRHGIILHTDSLDAVVAGNLVDDVGYGSSLSGNQAHGIYVQNRGHRIVRNVFARAGGYGIHVYGGPSNILISGNIGVASVHRTGIVVRTTGSSVVVVNNIFDRASFHSCGGCVIDTNQVAAGWEQQSSQAVEDTNTLVAPVAFADAEYRPAADSPAVDAARSDAVFPDRDGRGAPSGGHDLGAYERSE